MPGNKVKPFDFKNEFLQAMALGRKHQLPQPFGAVAMAQRQGQFVGEAHEQAFLDILVEALGQPWDIKRVAAQCLAVHMAALDRVSQIADMPAALTLGYVTNDAGRDIDRITSAQAEGWLMGGDQPGMTLKAHMWLTLPTMEVVDLTWLATHAYVRAKSPRDELALGVIARPADDIKGISYRPILSGDASLPFRIGAVGFALVP